MSGRHQENAVSVASDEPVMEVEISVFEVLWARHRGAVIATVVGVLLIGVGAFAWVSIASANRQAAEAAFASAKTAQDFRDVIAAHGGSVVAGEAYLLLAEKLRADGKLDEADAALKGFVQKMPDHPLVPLALLALANNAAAASQIDAAVEQYQAISDRYPKSFVASVALGNKAELCLANGRREEALTTLQVQQRLYPTSVATEVMAPQAAALQNLIGKPAVPPTSAPAPAN